MNQNIIKEVTIDSDYTVVGAGLPGICTAITSARAGLKVALVQDRPILGGNVSSEMRVWALGANASMDNNNRWAREGGVIDEILTENVFRNSEGNAYLIDALLLDKVLAEPNIKLFLNTSIQSASMNGNRINSVSGYNSNNETSYVFKSDFFSDSSGDGILGYTSGADFTSTAEPKEEFNETLVRDDSYGHCLGNSLMFLVKDTPNEVKFVAPSFALKDITKLPKYKEIELLKEGCHFWWMEYGGRFDTIHDAEEIKYELSKALYGIWDYIKNSGKFPQAKNKTLDWVGSIPGKREARRFFGDYMLNQNDIFSQKNHDDNVAYGGWSVDLHPASGMYSSLPSCSQWHAKGVYAIPYRCLYSRNVENLFLGGRLISASHVAFGSTRVMLTGSVCGQATGIAVALCVKYKLNPRDLLDPKYLHELQQTLIATGQHIPNIFPESADNLMTKGKITSNDTLAFSKFDPNTTNYTPLDREYAFLCPIHKGQVPSFKLNLQAFNRDEISIRIQTTEQLDNFTPSDVVETFSIPLRQGQQEITVNPTCEVNDNCYIYIALCTNQNVSVKTTTELLTGVTTVYRFADSIQHFEPEYHLKSFDRWHAMRHDHEFNLDIEFVEPQAMFSPQNLTTGHHRPLIATNAWVGQHKENSRVCISWDETISLENGVLTLFFDTNYNQSFETAGKNHHFHVLKYCVKDYTIYTETGSKLATIRNNHQGVNHIPLHDVKFEKLTIEINKTWGCHPAIFGAILQEKK